MNGWWPSESWRRGSLTPQKASIGATQLTSGDVLDGGRRRSVCRTRQKPTIRPTLLPPGVVLAHRDCGRSKMKQRVIAPASLFFLGVEIKDNLGRLVDPPASRAIDPFSK